MQKISVIKVFKESFSNVFKSMPSWMRLSFAPLTVWAIGFFLQVFLYTVNGEFTPSDLKFWKQITDQQIITSNNFFTIGNIIY